MEQLGHFRILEPIGAGGMGEVYRARDEHLHRDVAIKILPASTFADSTARARLLSEARSAAALNHPHICVVHEVGESNGQAFIAMECVDGKPLSALLAHGPLPASDVIRYGIQLADALAHAHDRGVIHRDLKPGNVMVTSENRIKVLDFGLAKRLDKENKPSDAATSVKTQPGSVAGTLAYMSPEQLRGHAADARADIWALGIILYEMACGARPFSASSWPELASAILTEVPKPLPAQVPLELRSIIERCLAKEPAGRYQRAGEVRAALEAVQAGAAWKLPNVRHVPVRSRWALLAAAAAVFVLAGVLTVNRNEITRFTPATSSRINSLAVMPLANLSGDAEQEYFVDGMHGALIGELAQLKGVRVISRTSMQQYKQNRKSASEIARELNVKTIVEGTVVRAGNNVRLQLQLIDPAGEERQLWAGSYERNGRDVLLLHREAAHGIARQIHAGLSPEDVARLTETRKVKTEAYDLYLRGIFYVATRKPELVRKGLALLHEANESDPTDPLPYSGLARAYALVGHLDDPKALARAKAAATKAVELDDSLVDAHEVLAEIKLYKDWDYPGAAAAFRRILELNPNMAPAHAHYGWYHRIYGRDDETLAEMKRAAELDPLNPLFTSWVGWMHWVLGRPDDAIAEAKRALELNPRFDRALLVLGNGYRDKGMHAQAIAAHELMVKTGPAMRSVLAVTYAKAGRVEDARAALEETERQPEKSHYYLAWAYAQLSRPDDAVRALEAGFRERDSLLPWIASQTANGRGFEALRTHPGFQEISRRLNLPSSTPTDSPVSEKDSGLDS